MEFSTCIGVCGCGCTISIATFISGVAYFVFSYDAPISVSDADPIIFFKTFSKTYTDPFSFALAGSDGKYENKCKPPVLPLYFGSVRYNASLCVCRIMSLLWCLILALG